MKKKIISWSLFILWLFVIFFFSSQNGTSSSNLSNSVLNSFVSILPVKIDISIFSFSIRKLAHFTEYLILGILTLNLLNLETKLNKKKIMIGILFCIMYACTDEFHQLFVSGRVGSILDILIDSCGSSFGICLYLLWKNKKEKV